MAPSPGGAVGVYSATRAEGSAALRRRTKRAEAGTDGGRLRKAAPPAPRSVGRSSGATAGARAVLTRRAFRTHAAAGLGGANGFTGTITVCGPAKARVKGRGEAVAATGAEATRATQVGPAPNAVSAPFRA